MRKNFNRIPKFILAELNEINSQFIKVGHINRILKADVLNGKFNDLSISINNGRIQYEDIILPPQQAGRYSKYNQVGRTIVRKDLPKINKTYSTDIYPYGNTNASTVTAYITRKVWQKEIILPEYINISVTLLNETNEYYEFMFEIAEILDKSAVTFEKQLLTYLNIMQENIGGVSIYAEDKTAQDTIIKSYYVDWELLPPGSVDIEYVAKNFPKKSNEEQKVALERYTFVRSLNPIALFRGRNSFNYYFGAEFSNGLVILENINVGNAIYIFYENWENLSKLTTPSIDCKLYA